MGFTVYGLRFAVYGSGIKVSVVVIGASGFWVSGLRLRVSGLRFAGKPSALSGED